MHGHGHHLSDARPEAAGASPSCRSLQRLWLPRQTNHGPGFADHGRGHGTAILPLRFLVVPKKLHFCAAGGRCCSRQGSLNGVAVAAFDVLSAVTFASNASTAVYPQQCCCIVSARRAIQASKEVLETSVFIHGDQHTAGTSQATAKCSPRQQKTTGNPNKISVSPRAFAPLLSLFPSPPKPSLILAVCDNSRLIRLQQVERHPRPMQVSDILPALGRRDKNLRPTDSAEKKKQTREKTNKM